MTHTPGRRALSFAAAVALLAAVLTGAGTATASELQPASTAGPLVVGGGDAPAYSAAASLQTTAHGDPNWHFCGATLIAPRWAVTNAHCVTRPDATPVPAELLHLRIGSADRTSGGTVAYVTAVVPHPSWDWATGDDPVADIALLRLDRAVPGPMAIARGADPARSEKLIGWGLTSMDQTVAAVTLQQLDTHVVTPAQCAAGGISAGELCLASAPGSGACYGDSGSPAIQRVYTQWQVIGGASRETNPTCGAAPSIYTDVTFYRAWIWHTMWTAIPPCPPKNVSSSNAWASRWARLWG